MNQPDAAAFALLRESLDNFRYLAWSTPEQIRDLRLLLLDSLGGGGTPDLPDLTFDRPAPAAIHQLAVRLERCVEPFHAHPLSHILWRASDQAHAYASAVEDDAAMAEWAAGTYGIPSGDDVDQALALLSAPDGSQLHSTAEGEVDGNDLAAMLRTALDAYDLTDWTVQANPKAAAGMSVSGHDKIVKYRPDLTWTHAAALRTISHEVEGHVLRHVNAAIQPPASLAALALSSVSPVPTEEGLASWIAERGTPDVQLRRAYAARTCAAAWSATAGALEVSRRLLESGISPVAAVDTTLRSKRGMQDVQGAGAFSKDHGYLSGLRAVTAHLDRHPDDFAPLMATKWGLDLLPAAKSLIAEECIRQPAAMPDSRVAQPAGSTGLIARHDT